MSRIQKRYDLDLLQTVVERDSIIIDIENIKNLSSLVRLDFICECGNPANKVFRMMLKNGARCKECMFEQHQAKSKETCLKVYGTEFCMQNKKIIEKMRKTFSTFSEQKKKDMKNKKIATCLKVYGSEYATQNKDVQKKIATTSIKLYGVKRASQLKKYQKMAEDTSLDRYGVRYAIQLKKYQLKGHNTCLKRYGVRNVICLPFFKIKREQTNISRFGVKFASQNISLKLKRIQTCLRKYGVEYVSQANIPRKPFKLKIFTFPCGKDIYVQGYEPFALEDLVKEGYNSEDILTCRSEVPKIWYITPDSKRHRYFVDIYIPKENKMIEVKSSYTYNLHQDKIILKAEECVRQGYVYEIWVYDYKKNREIFSFEMEK